jgi:hypothetical protein
MTVRKSALLALSVLALVGAHEAASADDKCGKAVLIRGQWTFACVDERSRNVCYFCPGPQITAACTKTVGVCPTR